MGPARDDGVVDPQQNPEPGDVERDRSFDPGLETGYLRRTPRDHELEPELGSVPFDPGPDRYDDRRARKFAKLRQRSEQPRLLPDQPASPSAPGPVALATGSADPADTAPRATPPAQAEVIELPRREPLAERLERERVERERAEQERRAKVEQERADREQAEQQRRERTRRERAEKLRREREALRPKRRPDQPTAEPQSVARVEPGVQGPVKKRVRAAENRRRVATRRRGLFWPTAKAGLAMTVAIALGAGLGSLLGLPVPGLDRSVGGGSLVNSASLFGIDPGTPAGLVHGYVFPLRGPHDFGDKIARFGAPRSGHIHEGQDIFGKTGTQEIAVHDGIVVDRGKATDPDDGGRGNYVVIYSPSDNHSFVYMHMLKPSPVQLGDKVHSGDLVGQLGCTGSCDGPHLHFEVRIGKASLGADTKPIDPLPFLKQWPESTPG
jgi:murein DD-endopeptidase MepM/ murein hydrolase activator NlpD